jgi:hypothetical protein
MISVRFVVVLVVVVVARNYYILEIEHCKEVFFAITKNKATHCA